VRARCEGAAATALRLWTLVLGTIGTLQPREGPALLLPLPLALQRLAALDQLRDGCRIAAVAAPRVGALHVGNL